MKFRLLVCDNDDDDDEDIRSSATMDDRESWGSFVSDTYPIKSGG